MPKRIAVKIIKRAQFAAQEQPEEHSEEEIPVKRNTKHEIVQTVTGWINELKEKKQTETRRDLSLFFSKA